MKYPIIRRSKNPHGRFRDSDLFRWLFNEVLRRCMDAGLVKGAYHGRHKDQRDSLPSGFIGAIQIFQ